MWPIQALGFNSQSKLPFQNLRFSQWLVDPPLPHPHILRRKREKKLLPSVAIAYLTTAPSKADLETELEVMMESTWERVWLAMASASVAPKNHACQGWRG